MRLPRDPETGKLAGLDLSWDTPLATATIVAAALAFLWLVQRGFSGLVVRVGA